MQTELDIANEELELTTMRHTKKRYRKPRLERLGLLRHLTRFTY